MLNQSITARSLAALATLATGIALASAPAGGLVGTGLLDFKQPGTQPFALVNQITESVTCSGCHGYFDIEDEPYRRWAASMMAQAARDPIFYAALAIAEQDADFAGELCLRCHTPGGWLGGRSQPTDGSGLSQIEGDLDGVNCNFCHRMVDPVAAGENPLPDAGILAGLSLPPVNEVHSGQYVVDPIDRRRGPFDLDLQFPSGFPYHQWLESPFHRESLLCATCHDVSNPALEKQPDGSYDLGLVPNTPHPTHDKNDEFPIERTFSEWANSVFAIDAQEMGGRFGGNQTEVATCQDCHLPKTDGVACAPGLGGANRSNLPQHDFNGANSWVLRAVDYLYPSFETGLEPATVDDSIARNVTMLQNAADLHAFERGGDLVVRVVNQTGHKLPTGYGEGRRMWVNVQFVNAAGGVINERGAYDLVTADLTTGNTTVYEVEHGLDADMAGDTGLPAGPSFHFVLNNTTYKDNRIPPRGFNNAAFDAVDASPVATTYANEHYWDDSTFDIPGGAVSVIVNLYHQTTSKEYIEFLKNENTTNTTGQLAYDMWVMFGKSEPVLMQTVAVDLSAPECPDPIPYGIGSVNSSGKRAKIGWSGAPSFAAGNFAVTVTDAPANKFGAAFYGFAPNNVPFFSGSLLVAGPQRGPYFVTDANGEASVPFPVTAQMVGTTRYYQVLFRDQTLPTGVGLSDALFVEFCD